MKPFGDQPVVLRLALGRTPLAAIKIATAEVDLALPGPLVVLQLGNGSCFRPSHARTSEKRGIGYYPIPLPNYGSFHEGTADRRQVTISLVSKAFPKVGATGFEPATS